MNEVDLTRYSAYEYCLDYIKNEISNKNWNLSISEGGGYRMLPSINRKRQTAYIPKYLEGLLILDVLGAYEDFVILLLAIHMLINDEYGYCDELLESLNQSRNALKPTEFLYEMIKAEHLFLVLHELGHYAFEESEDVRHILKTSAEELLQILDSEGIFQPDSEDLDWVTEVIKQELPISMEYENMIRDYVGSLNFESARGVLSKEQKIEELAADMFALKKMELAISTHGQSGNTFDKVSVLGVYNALHFVTGMIGSNHQLDTGGVQQGQMIIRSHELTAFDSIRYAAASALLRDLFEVDIDLPDESEYLTSEIKRSVLLAEDRFDKYVEITVNGSNSQKDSSKFNECYHRLLLYVDGLRSLYA